MADQKLTALTALATLSADDLFYVVDDPAGAATPHKLAASVLDAKYLQAANNLSDLANAGMARANLGLAIGANVQAYDAFLASIAGLGTAADRMIYTTGVDTAAETGLSAFARSFLDDASEAAFKATVNLEIGVDVQAWDADLDTIAGLAKADGNFIVGDGAAWTVESGATARTSLGLGTIATQAANSVSITGGSITGITDLAIADGGTGQSTAQAAIDALSNVVAATNEHVLTKDTVTGNAIFKAATGGSGSPGGADTQVQFNDGGAFGGDTALVWNKTANSLTLAGSQFIDGSADAIQLRVQANATQSSNPAIFTLEKSDGTVFGKFNADGRVAFGQAIVFSDTEAAIWSTATNRKTLALRAITGQTADLLEFQDNSGNQLAVFQSDGGFHSGPAVSGSYFSISGSQGGLYLHRTGTNEPFIYLLNDTAGSGGQIRGLNAGGFKITDSSAGTDLMQITTAGITLVDARNIILGTTTGTKFGTATTQKMGWWNATPVVQPTGIADADGTLADATTKLNSLIGKLETIGLLAVA